MSVWQQKSQQQLRPVSIGFHRGNEMNKVWLHFIGGYYQTIERFINEAKAKGITRRIPAQIARGINFGDRVILLRWQEKSALAFAEAVVTGITLDSEVSEYVQEKLKEQGKIQDTGSDSNLGPPVCISRECGSYLVMSSSATSATIAEIIELAIEFQEKPFVMIACKLTDEYHQQFRLEGTKFTRGIILCNTFVQEQADFFKKEKIVNEKTIISISNYKKAS